MTWILLAVIAHLFYAGVFILDRYLLKKGFPNPLSYGFWTGLLSVFVIVLIPFGFQLPSVNQIIVSLITGSVWILAIILFYTALYKGEASRVVPTIGGLIPIFTLVLSILFLQERLNPKQLIAFVLLVAGGFILSFLVSKARIFSGHRTIKLSNTFLLALGAAFIFAIYFIMTKFIFMNQNFISGLILIRVGAALSAGFLIIPSKLRKKILKQRPKINKKSVSGLFATSKIMGATASLLLYYAIFLGSVSLVNSIQGVQYLFLLILAYLLFRKIPDLKETFGKRALFQKIIAILLIMVGLVLLVL